ncbi:MAG: oxygenase [Gammaproteobacteria bacterium]|nr:MAG: oxygenase [Gammaproteobacteria bacterium]
MAYIVFDDNCINIEQGHYIPHSCRSGICQTCLMQATDGEVPAAAQAGLKNTLVSQGYFLACCCKPETPLHVITAPDKNIRHAVNVISHDLLNAHVLRLRLERPDNFDYHPGQFLTVWKEDTVGRSYSLASVPGIDNYLELHIRRMPNGKVSNWLHDDIDVDDVLHVQAATGNCFYTPDAPEQKMILAGTGTGLSPIIGIVRDALQQQHRGEIHLVHGAMKTDDLYLHQTLQDLDQRHNQFFYHTNVLHADEDHPLYDAMSLDQKLLHIGEDLTDCRIFLCGDPNLVNSLKKTMFMAGASMKNIYADPFIAAYD